MCDGPVSDGSEGNGRRFYELSPSDAPVACVRSGTVIWSPEQPNREPEAERATTAEELLIEIPYEYLGPDGRTLVNTPRDGRPDGIGV